MDLPLEVAGNFMELRNNHFHSGLDMKTNGVIGQPIRAVADGWVSRIKFSPWGYGKAIYVDHPSGYTTVYGHLSRLNAPLADVLLDLQYAERDYSVDHSFKRGELPVTEGQVIAFSGNTGGSTAPHLHFEVRRTADQHAVDPEAYGMNPADHAPPTFFGLRLYPLDSTSSTSPYPAENTGFTAVRSNDSTYVIKAGQNLLGQGTIGLAVNVIDRYDESQNTCGIRTLAVEVDGRRIFSADLNDVDFGLQRYANAYMDYALFIGRQQHYNRCFKLPNNKLAFYGKEEEQGRIQLAPGQQRAVKVVATDPSGNRSILSFMLIGASAEEAARWPKVVPKGQACRYDRINVMERPGMRFSLPPNALYEDTYIATSVGPAPEKALAPLFQVQNDHTPLQLAGELTLDVTGKFPAAQASKLLMVKVQKGRTTPAGGSYANGKLTAAIKTFGAYTVMLDTVPPVIKPIDLVPEMKGRKGFRIKVTDNLSGPDKWAGTMDGKWIVMEYIPGANVLEHVFDKNTDLPGRHEFKLEVVDERGNRSSIARSFER